MREGVPRPASSSEGAYGAASSVAVRLPAMDVVAGAPDKCREARARQRRSCAFSSSRGTWRRRGVEESGQARERATRKSYPEDMPEMSRDQDFEKELEKHERRRHRKNWKGGAQRIASKLASAIKTHGDSMKHHSESEAPSLPESRSTDRSTELEALGSHYDSDASSEDKGLVPSSFFSGEDGKLVITSPNLEFPSPLSEGVIVDQKFAVSAKALNAIIFKPGSPFIRELVQAQNMTDYVEEPWKKVGNESIKRSISYTRAATKLIKAVKAFETQTYLRADDEGFCVLVSSSSPGAPYGGSFVVEMQVLSKHATPLESSRPGPPAFDDEKPISDWEIAWDYFKNWHVLRALVCVIFILLHIALALPKRKCGLEFWIIRFPNSLMELITSAVIVVQVEHVAIMVYNFTRSYYLQSADHGVKAQGDGWLITVSLIEGADIAYCDSGTPSPYVVFTWNGNHRTSSVNSGTTHPTWRETFEFGPTEDPPSTMDVEVFHYDGPFSEAESLGRAEVNFLKRTPGQLEDFWLPLNGRDAQPDGSELHLQVYLTNTRAADALPEYLERVEREVGLKVRKRSAQKNGSFQKLFSLPAEEFLLDDFACAIKRKILIQGRLFLSPRLLGFYSNLFGHKTKFTLLWEDIEEIKETVAQSINPSIIIFTRKGRGFDARRGARGIDRNGRLKFQFLSFVRSGSAFRAIVALWNNINLSNQKMDVVASVEAGDMKYAVAERKADDQQPFLGIEEASMSKLVHTQIPITVETVNTVMEDDKKDCWLNDKLGLSNYESSPWEAVDGNNDVRRRHRSYKLERLSSQFGGKISCIQQKTMSDDSMKLVINENLIADDVRFGDPFQIQVRIELETLSLQPITTQYKAFVGVAWRKATELDQRKMTKNIYEHMTNHLRYLVQLIAEE